MSSRKLPPYRLGTPCMATLWPKQTKPNRKRIGGEGRETEGGGRGGGEGTRFVMRAPGQEAAMASIAAPRPGWQRIERAVLGACQGPITARTRLGGGVEGLPGHGGGGGPGFSRTAAGS